MNGIHDFLRSNEDVSSVIDGISNGMNEQLVAGLSGSARSLFVSVLDESLKRPVLLVTHHLVDRKSVV